MEPQFLLYPVIGIASPFVLFFLGVYLADKIGLYSSVSRKSLYLTAIVPGFIFPAMLALGSSVTINGTTYYGYLDSVFKYALFAGTLMIYGCAAPHLLTSLLRKILAHIGR